MECGVTIVSSLVSGLLATILTLVVSNILKSKKAKYDYKMNLFCSIIAYRSDMTNMCVSTGKFQEAINQVFIAFNNNQKVLTAFENFRKAATYNQGDKINTLITLIKEMAIDLGIDYNFSNDDLFTTPIIVQKIEVDN